NRKGQRKEQTNTNNNFCKIQQRKQKNPPIARVADGSLIDSEEYELQNKRSLDKYKVEPKQKWKERWITIVEDD
ncbi:hypothetical protein ACJMK2_038280, partial [Sinanodonta woodiana]